MSAMTLDEIRELIRRRAMIAGSKTALARAMGVCDSTLHNILVGKKGAGPQVLAALGLHEVTVVEPTPVTEPVPVTPSTYQPMWRFGDWPVFRRQKGAR